MIRYRLTQLDAAAGRIIEMMRSSRLVEGVAKEALTILALAAGSDWAAYWVADPELRCLRPLAIWSALTPTARGCECDTGHRILSPSQGNAAHVWRNRKPLWSLRLLLDMGLPRLHGDVWFAVKTDTAVFGVIELLGRALEPAAPDNLINLERLGFRLGLALEHRPHALH